LVSAKYITGPAGVSTPAAGPRDGGVRESSYWNKETQLQDNIQCYGLLFAAGQSAHTAQPVAVQEFLKRL